MSNATTQHRTLAWYEGHIAARRGTPIYRNPYCTGHIERGSARRMQRKKHEEWAAGHRAYRAVVAELTLQTERTY